jgi:hypothetical protein
MQFEGGEQPVSGASGPITGPILPVFPDVGQNTSYEYGAREGVPRILDLLDSHGITMTSFMIGDAVRRHPEVGAQGRDRPAGPRPPDTAASADRAPAPVSGLPERSA